MSKIIFNETTIPPTTPSVNKAAITVTENKKIRLTTSDGVSSEFAAPPVYGTEFLSSKASFLDTNQTNVFKTYTNIAYPAGTYTNSMEYKIEFSCLTRYSTTGRNHIIRISIDGLIVEEEISIEHKDTGTDIRFPVGYIYIIDGSQLNNAGGFIDLDFRAQQNGDTARMYSATLLFKRTI